MKKMITLAFENPGFYKATSSDSFGSKCVWWGAGREEASGTMGSTEFHHLFQAPSVVLLPKPSAALTSHGERTL